MIAALDATLDEASTLTASVDRGSVDEPVGQALDLITAAEALADDLMELLGITDPDDAGDTDVAASRRISARHGADPGAQVTHSHAHSAFGAQGSDATHTHEHTHAAGDATHNHHAKASKAGGQVRGAAEMDFSDDQGPARTAGAGRGRGDHARADHGGAGRAA